MAKRGDKNNSRKDSNICSLCSRPNAYANSPKGPVCVTCATRQAMHPNDLKPFREPRGSDDNDE